MCGGGGLRGTYKITSPSQRFAFLLNLLLEIGKSQRKQELQTNDFLRGFLSSEMACPTSSPALKVEAPDPRKILISLPGVKLPYSTQQWLPPSSPSLTHGVILLKS